MHPLSTISAIPGPHPDPGIIVQHRTQLKLPSSHENMADWGRKATLHDQKENTTKNPHPNTKAQITSTPSSFSLPSPPDRWSLFG